MKPDTTAFHDPLAIQLANEGNEVRQMCEAIAHVPIQSQEDLDRLAAGAAEARRRGKELEEQQKAKTDPHNAYVKSVREFYKPARDAYDALRIAIDDRIKAHYRQVAAQREQLQQAAGAQFQLGNAPAAHATLAHVPPPAQAQGVTIRKSVKFQVINADMVPREFCSPDGGKIGEAVKVAGLACVIPGVRVFEDETVAVRS